MSIPSSGTGTTTYQHVNAGTESGTVTQTMTITEQIARFFADDLLKIVRQANIDIARSLGANGEDYLTDPDQLIWLLCNDLEQMLADGLINRVHFMLCEEEPGGTGGAYRVGYHAEYQIMSTRVGGDMLEYGQLRLPRDATLWQKFVLVIDWDPTAPVELRRQCVYPKYIFNWFSPSESFDTRYLVRFERGGLGTAVARIQYAQPDGLAHD